MREKKVTELRLPPEPKGKWVSGGCPKCKGTLRVFDNPKIEPRCFRCPSDKNIEWIETSEE